MTTATLLPRSTPSSQGVAAAGIDAFVTALEALDHVEPHSLMLVRHGQVVAEGWWAPYAADRLHLMYSLTKSFTSTALGFAVAEGLLSLDDTVLSHFPELDAEITDPRSRRIRLRHAAAMASGHREETFPQALDIDPDNPIRGFLLIPPDEEPGTLFAYNQPCSIALAVAVARASGGTVTDFLRPRLLDPLGIGPLAWQRTPDGIEVGNSGLHATTEDVAKLGLLYLQRGVWEGRQVLPAGWAEEATRKQVDNDHVFTNPDWQQGYGFQFWMARHGFRGDGAYGQFCVVLPEQGAVLAMTAATEDMQAILDAAWEHLLPALTADPGTSGTSGAGPGASGQAGQGGQAGGVAADEALAARLTRLVLPTVPGDARPPSAHADRWAAFEGRAADERGLVSVSLTGDVDAGDVDAGGGRAVLGFVDPDGTAHRLDVPLGTGGWAVSEPAGPDGVPLPIATSAAWTDADTLRLDVVFLETPHRLQATCLLPGSTVMTQWRTAPLWDAPLATLRAPRD